MAIEKFENRIKEIISEIIETDVDKITPTADFVSDLGMDSMQALEIMAAVEKEFKIQIPEEYLEKISNFSNLLELTKEISEKKSK